MATSRTDSPTLSASSTAPAAPKNKFLARFLTTKHSWKGKYKRIISIADNCLVTVNPGSWEITNRWPYNEEFVDILPSQKNPQEFNITLRKKGSNKTETLVFSSPHRHHLLTVIQRLRKAFVSDTKSCQLDLFSGKKLGWSGTTKPTILCASFASIDQIGSSDQVLCSYDYKDIEKIEILDSPGGLIIYVAGFGRMHLFSLDSRDEFLRKAKQNAQQYVGISLQIMNGQTTREQFELGRLGSFSNDEAITSLAEFKVFKHSSRSSTPTARILCITEVCVVERDPSSYAIVTIRPLSDVFSVIRYKEDAQKFSIEYKSGVIRRYSTTDRDPLLASLLDGVRASGNREVCIKRTETNIFDRVGPWNLPVEEEIQIMYLKSVGLYEESVGISFDQMVSRFNVNVDYSGLNLKDLLDSKEKELVQNAINAVLTLGQPTFETNPQAAAEQFECLRRLFSCKVGFESFTSLEGCRVRLGKRVVQALKMSDDGVIYAAIDMLCSLMQPMHDFYDLVQEQTNKKSLLMSRPFLNSLIALLGQHAQHGTGALIISALLDFLTFALCEPYSQTTDGEQFDILLTMVADLNRKFFKLFQHPSLAIVKGSGLLMRTIIEEGSVEIFERMQSLALSEGAILKHLHTAMFTQSSDHRLLIHRELSRQLVDLWTADNPASPPLLKQMIPQGLLNYLDSKDVPPEEETVELDIRDKKAGVKPKKQSQLEALVTHWKNRSFLRLDGKQKPQPRALVVRAKKIRDRTKSNWAMFYYQIRRDHARPDLIWNHKTREELKDALETELRAFNIDKDLGGAIEVAWNFVEFEVRYESLSEELKIGEHYVRLLLEQGVTAASVRQPFEFFFDLYHRFLLATTLSMRTMCLQAMSIIYGAYYKTIGVFNDLRYIVKMLTVCNTKMERDRLLTFIDKLLYLPENTKEFIASNGIKLLVDMMTLAHLHVDRAVTPLQSNLIEAGDIKRENEKEWYYSNDKGEKQGPFGFDEIQEHYQQKKINADTKCWAQGMDGWRKLSEISQLKWSIISSDVGFLNESEIAVICLNILIRICEMYPSRAIDGAIIRPLPKVKRILSEPSALPHIVNLFLTFDPPVVERVALLLTDIMEDNPVLPKLFMTGAFFFALMYPGSNILPLAKLLEKTHNKQAFRSEEDVAPAHNFIAHRSVVGSMLPTAMVCYLENYGSSKFAETFLGDFDTPEAIWNHEMRRFLIEKISVHLAEFTPRLLSNTHALYQYCPIPKIQYPQLEDELFCNIYYLRHLCDLTRFPDWPIKNPIELLKDILDEWKREVEKKLPQMSYDEALHTLGLDKEKAQNEQNIRRNYFKLAAKYHPDKNPEGREMFESVNKAYEYLLSSNKSRLEGPDPENIILVLQSQSILFFRFPDVLKPYKYAGYPMLIKTIQMEAMDDRLFSRPHPLLPAASELAFHTVNVSALNAEELRREGGIEVVSSAFVRCVDVIQPKTSPEEVSVQVSTHLMKLYNAAGAFDLCRQKIGEQSRVVPNIARCLYFNGAPKLTIAALETVSTLAIDHSLQEMLLDSGTMWHLLHFLFQYDYTLTESGVKASVESNQQEILNYHAHLAFKALARLGGYFVRDENSPTEIPPVLAVRRSRTTSMVTSASTASVDSTTNSVPSSTDSAISTSATEADWKSDRILNGIEMETPINERLRKGLHSLLTPYLEKQLQNRDPTEALKLATSNSETPYLIWNNDTRAELIDIIDRAQEKAIKGTLHDKTLGAGYVYTSLKEELLIGDIYVRVYNQQPAFVLSDYDAFVIALLVHLRRYGEIFLKNLTPEDDPSVEERVKVVEHTEQSLEALRNVIRIQPEAARHCLQRFKLIFYFLRLVDYVKIQVMALETIAVVTGNKDCVAAIAEAGVIVNLLTMIQQVPSSHEVLLEVLQALSSNSKIVAELLSKGALIYLLHLFCNSRVPTIRIGTASVFAKMSSDKLHGPRVILQLAKFLPNIFMDAMRENAEAAVHMFESSQENPELVWDDDARRQVQNTVTKMFQSLYKEHLENPSSKFSLPDDLEPVYGTIEGQLVVSGVFVQLFIKQPHWGLRNPKDFAVGLIDTYLRSASEVTFKEEILRSLSDALVLLLNVQTLIAPYLASLGYIAKLFNLMNSTDHDAILSTEINIVRALSNHPSCIESMVQISCISPLMHMMKNTPQLSGSVADTLLQLFEKNNPEKVNIVKQALEAQLIPFLLSALETHFPGVENPSAVKAQIVNAIKAMLKDLQYGQDVQALLDESTVWNAYRDQRHDLFLTHETVKGYLTGPTSASKGYLTAGPANVTLPTAPPPIDDQPTIPSHNPF